MTAWHVLESILDEITKFGGVGEMNEPSFSIQVH